MSIQTSIKGFIVQGLHLHLHTKIATSRGFNILDEEIIDHNCRQYEIGQTYQTGYSPVIFVKSLASLLWLLQARRGHYAFRYKKNILSEIEVDLIDIKETPRFNQEPLFTTTKFTIIRDVAITEIATLTGTFECSGVTLKVVDGQYHCDKPHPAKVFLNHYMEWWNQGCLCKAGCYQWQSKNGKSDYYIISPKDLDLNLSNYITQYTFSPNTIIDTTL